MSIRERLASMKALALAPLAAAILIAGPSAAEAQARGTLQATAVVVDTRPSVDALGRAQRAAQQWVSSTNHRGSTVTTLATVTLAERSAVAGLPEQKTLVVTIDYSRN